MPKPLPFPADIVYNSKAWLMTDTLVKGAVMAIVFPWWLSGCKAIDTSVEANLKDMAAIGDKRWSRKSHDIKLGLDDLLPRLEKAFRIALKRQQSINERNAKGAYRLIEYNRMKRLNSSKDVSVANGSEPKKLSEGLVNDYKLLDESGRMDVYLPATLPKTSPKPPKRQGVLRDK